MKSNVRMYHSPEELAAMDAKSKTIRSRPRRTVTRLVSVPVAIDVDNAPKVGDSVVILHGSEVDRGGNARLKRTGNPAKRTVRAVYLGDTDSYSIQDDAGEVWDVRLAAMGGTKWETFIPGEKLKVKVVE